MKQAALTLLFCCATLLSCSDSESTTQQPQTSEVGAVREASCATCHEQEAAAWRGSHHDLAMDHATDATVLGNFDDVTLEHATGTARFFRKDGGHWIRTTGHDGTDQDFRVSYVFGVDPLQQYLIEFPGGAIQSCDLAWDVDDQKWFDLTPEEPNGAADPLHWTGSYQRWNTMCAECHSTQLNKKYDFKTGQYKTSWSEIDVSCEACHGEGSGHLAWIEDGSPDSTPQAGFARPLRRGELADQVEACAECHSRRTAVAPDDFAGTFFDRYEPATLRPGLYHVDGQILDEVYVYGSFAQSKMYSKGVACTECHDPHTAKLVLEGNALCGQCHTPLAPIERFPTLQKKEYDSPEHHHHEVGSPGSQCIACHMPERTYMQIDERHDHSFRIPRPDISVDLGTPNACTDCHTDQDAKWSAGHVTEWYGEREDKKPHFAYILDAARLGDPQSFPWLADLATDLEQPAIVRATAIEALELFGPNAYDTLASLLTDEEPFVRSVAARSLSSTPLQQRVGALLPLLTDPVRSVRIQAARSLAELLAQSILPKREKEQLAAGLAEYRAAQEYAGDMPGPHLNLGRLYEDSGDRMSSIAEYKRALEIDPWFVQAAFNLTAVLNRMGRNAEAEQVLRDALERFPDEGELHYSLGLLLAELKRMEDALIALTDAARLIPRNPRIHYNRGLVLRELNRMGEAENSLLSAYSLTPGDPQLVHALVLLYQQQADAEAATRFAQELVRLRPEEPKYRELLKNVVDGSGR